MKIPWVKSSVGPVRPQHAGAHLSLDERLKKTEARTRQDETKRQKTHRSDREEKTHRRETQDRTQDKDARK